MHTPSWFEFSVIVWCNFSFYQYFNLPQHKQTAINVLCGTVSKQDLVCISPYMKQCNVSAVLMPAYRCWEVSIVSILRAHKRRQDGWAEWAAGCRAKWSRGHGSVIRIKQKDFSVTSLNISTETQRTINSTLCIFSAWLEMIISKFD